MVPKSGLLSLVVNSVTEGNDVFAVDVYALHCELCLQFKSM